jgi:hypothetical protein
MSLNSSANGWNGFFDIIGISLKLESTAFPFPLDLALGLGLGLELELELELELDIIYRVLLLRTGDLALVFFVG